MYIYTRTFSPILLHLPETTHLHNTSKLLLSLVFFLVATTRTSHSLPTHYSLTTHSLFTFCFSLFIFSVAHTTTEITNENGGLNSDYRDLGTFQCFSHYPRSTTTSKSGIRDVSFRSAYSLYQWVRRPYLCLGS